MTIRLYYVDAALLAFDAVAIGHGAEPTHLLLDRTAFYPTSGGQPHDLGRINDVDVVDVIDAGDQVIHVTASAIGLGPVRGEIDAARRHDHVQQHSAQHLLSAIAADLLHWNTTSVHFGAVHSTIEFAIATASDQQLRQLEDAANAAVAEARNVSVSFESAVDARSRGLRTPSEREGTLRVVTIDGLDRSACGGTHVSSTSGIGPIWIDGIERVRGAIRVSFLAGGRVLAAARRNAEALAAVAASLSCSADEVVSIIASRQQELTVLRRSCSALELEAGGSRAEQLLRETPRTDDGLAHMRVTAAGESPAMLRAMALRVAGLERATLLVSDASAGTVYYATSADSGVDAGSKLKAALTAAGGRGGGNTRLAQGSVATEESLAQVGEALRS